jgi:bifunctional UDP-N-acetylglucosamine pyrophosphorylase/glucosamine-1-phosphate N-acetyltransferase
MATHTAQPTAAIILAAGKGTRMKSALPKVMHKIGNFPMVAHVAHTAQEAGLAPLTLVTAPHMDKVVETVRMIDAEVRTAEQTEQLGTGHAVLCAREALTDFSGNLMVLYGDTPLITAETLMAMQECLLADAHTALVVLGFTPAEAGGYGRLVRANDGTLEKIVEAKDASPEERKISLCNSGVMALRGDIAWSVLEAIDCQNAKGEYYLTDAVQIARAQGYLARIVEADEEEVLGVNSRADLAVAEEIFQWRARDYVMAHGVTLQQPESVFFSADTDIAADVTIEPCVYFGSNVTIAEGATIKAFSHIEGSVIGAYASIGPFARLRPGTQIGESARIGNFVEIKKSEIEAGAKINHLSYIGDASVGEDANVGAGTITCNYDGFHKYRTVIGAGAFIGSNTALVAPVTVGDGAIVAAGSVITEDIKPDALALARPRQEQKDLWASAFRERQAKK